MRVIPFLPQQRELLLRILFTFSLSAERRSYRAATDFKFAGFVLQESGGSHDEEFHDVVPEEVLEFYEAVWEGLGPSHYGALKELEFAFRELCYFRTEDDPEYLNSCGDLITRCEEALLSLPGR